MPPTEGSPSRASVFQIFYDESSRNALDGGFIPLDNSRSERPEWYEFWPILKFLQSTALVEGRWYGFLSPRFQQKTGLDSAGLYSILARAPAEYDVLLASHGTDRIIWFDNIFSQGELWHTGLMQSAQAFADYACLNIDVRTLISHSHNAAFSNFVIAKPGYWRRWKLLAEQLVSFSREQGSADGMANVATRHRSKRVPMLVFLQERLPALVLLDMTLRCAPLPLTFSLRRYDARVQELLIAMDVLKREYAGERSGDFGNALRRLQDQLTYDMHARKLRLRKT